MWMYYFGIFVILNLVQMYSLATFGYSKREQHLWAKTFKSCAGKSQSPIAIMTQKAVVMPLPALEMIGFHDFITGSVVVKNNGHSVTLIFNGENLKERRPYVFGAMLNDKHCYELESLHFHWGNKNDRGSEHTLNGVRFPMEMHMIFRNTIYSELAEALNHEDGLTVLATFFQLQDDDNEYLSPILRTFSAVQWLDSELKLNSTFTLKSLLSTDVDTYYTYRGSLTTPPCSEAVTWVVFSKPVPISFKQMNKFRILSNGEDSLVDNYRKLQAIGNRKVYLRKLSSVFSQNLDIINNFNVSNLDWFWR